MATSDDELERCTKAYIDTRVDQYLAWYDMKATRAKRNYFRVRVIAAVGAVIVPILSNTAFSLTISAVTLDVSRTLVTVVSLTVAILIALEGVLHYREQWQNYRSTEQFLKTQRILFENRVGDYSKLDDKAAFKELVARVEGAIAEENAVTLNVLARTEAQSSKTE